MLLTYEFREAEVFGLRKPYDRKLRTPLENKNVDYLEKHGWNYGLLGTSKTSLDKGISDATDPFRKFLKQRHGFDYDDHPPGKDNKSFLPAVIVGRKNVGERIFASLYLPTRGDRRVGFTKVLKENFQIDDIAACVWAEDHLWVLNASAFDFEESAVLTSLIISNASQIELREYLRQLTIDFKLGPSANLADQGLLLHSSWALESILPAGLKVIAGIAPDRDGRLVPFIYILDPDETSTVDDGICLAWFFNAESQEVVLALILGGKAVLEQFGPVRGREVLCNLAQRIRNDLRLSPIELESNLNSENYSTLGRYADVVIAANRYASTEMPSDANIRLDLSRMCRLYQAAASANRTLSLTEEGHMVEGSPAGTGPAPSPVFEFKPKDKADYIVQVMSRTDHRRGDRHELLLQQYAAHATRLGIGASNSKVHPRDLILINDNREWLVEAKVVYNGDARQAVRAAIAQLIDYSYFYYEQGNLPGQMALFTEPIGGALVGLLDNLGIASVWKGDDDWEGSAVAEQAGLV